MEGQSSGRGWSPIKREKCGAYEYHKISNYINAISLSNKMTSKNTCPDVTLIQVDKCLVADTIHFNFFGMIILLLIFSFLRLSSRPPYLFLHFYWYSYSYHMTMKVGIMMNLREKKRELDMCIISLCFWLWNLVKYEDLSVVDSTRLYLWCKWFRILTRSSLSLKMSTLPAYSHKLLSLYYSSISVEY